MVFSLSKRCDFSLFVQSRSFVTLPVHWFGRTLLCPGDDRCPACHCCRPKRYHYAACTIERRLEVVEFCDSLGRCFTEVAATFPGCTLSGFWARGRRANKRSVWDLEKVGYAPEHIKEVADRVVIDAISSLYQLPLGAPGEPLRTWVDRVRCCHVPLLSNCVIA